MRAAATVAAAAGPRLAPSAEPAAAGLAPDRRWYEAAAAMERLARSWGDQPYGAVLVLGGAVVGHGPSRVVQLGDPTAHAEREAIRDAQRQLGRSSLAGSMLYSTSRPCRLCEAAAAGANVARMIYGEELHDAGVPRASSPAFKGIELYSWRTCSSCEWQFSLLPGTNRSKTAEEVRRPSTAISGVARLEQRLALLAEGEQVFWFHRSLAELAYPEPETIAGIVRFAAERNVRVVVPR
jgi:tRNA(adenine34) deaminase